MDLKKCEENTGKPVWINADQVTFVEGSAGDAVVVHMSSGAQRTIKAKGNPFTDPPRHTASTGQTLG